MNISLVNKISVFVIGVTILLLLYVFYLLLIPVKVLEVYQNPLPVKNKTIKLGDTVKVVFDYCKHQNVPSFITASYVEGVLLPSLSTINEFPTGCHRGDKARILEVATPYGIQPGEYHLLVLFDYQVNNLRRERYQFQSEKFTLIADENATSATEDSRRKSPVFFSQPYAPTPSTKETVSSSPSTPSQNPTTNNYSTTVNNSPPQPTPNPTPQPTPQPPSPTPIICLLGNCLHL